MLAEKVRAALQQVKVRDLFDLHRFAATPFESELLRQLAVLKLWQTRDPFDPGGFFQKRCGGDYDWAHIERLIRPSERLEPEQIISTVESHFEFLRQLFSQLHLVRSAEALHRVGFEGRLERKSLPT